MTRGFMSVGEFRALFAGAAVRTWVDWSALTDDNAVVSTRLCLRAAQLGECSTVWYRSRGEPTHWREQGALRVTVADEVRHSGISGIDETFVDTPHMFPALDTGAGTVMLLDGNHRAVALASSGGAIHVLVVILTGPRDPLVFPDLIHEVHGASSRSTWSGLVSQIDGKFAHA